ncbi:hypothetical protein CHUAL_005783 [Chamberlinius hualienensis]
MPLQFVGDIYNRLNYEGTLTTIRIGLVACLILFVNGATLSFSTYLPQSMDSEKSPFYIGPNRESWIASIIEFGAMAGSMLAAFLPQWLGRKSALLISCFPFAFGYLLIISSPNVNVMYAGRFITGIGCSLAFGTAIIYITEIAPTKIRGSLAEITFTVNAIGAALSNWYSSTMGTYVNWNWIGVTNIGITLLSALAICTVPETPRWLLSKAKKEQVPEKAKFYEDKAKNVLKKLRNNYNLDAELDSIREALKFGRQQIYISVENEEQTRQRLEGTGSEEVLTLDTTIEEESEPIPTKMDELSPSDSNTSEEREESENSDVNEDGCSLRHIVKRFRKLKRNRTVGAPSHRNHMSHQGGHINIQNSANDHGNAHNNNEIVDNGEDEDVLHLLARMRPMLTAFVRQLFWLRTLNRTDLFYVFCCVLMQTVYTMNGTIVINLYSVQIFKVSRTDISADAQAILLSITRLVSALLCAFTFDRLGRKWMTFSSLMIQAVCTTALATYYYVDLKVNHVYAEAYLFWLPLTSMLLFELVLQWGSTAVLLMDIELFSTDKRSGVSGLVSTWRRLAGFLVAYFFDRLVIKIGLFGAFWLSSGFCVMGALFYFFIVPETQNKSLEEIQKDIHVEGEEQARIRLEGSEVPEIDINANVEEQPESRFKPGE